MDREEEKEKMKIRRTGFLICIILAAIMIVSASSVGAQEMYQYTKGRALTEAEIDEPEIFGAEAEVPPG